MATVRGGSRPTVGVAPAGDLVERQVGHVDVDDDRLGGRRGEDGADDLARPTVAAVSQCWSAIISSQPWPSTPNPATAWLTATPLMPPLRAVSAAPTVPEW